MNRIALILRRRPMESVPGSGSDRVSGNNQIEIVMSLARSLPLKVLTSLKSGHCQASCWILEDAVRAYSQTLSTQGKGLDIHIGIS